MGNQLLAQNVLRYIRGVAQTGDVITECSYMYKHVWFYRDSVDSIATRYELVCSGIVSR